MNNLLYYKKQLIIFIITSSAIIIGLSVWMNLLSVTSSTVESGNLRSKDNIIVIQYNRPINSADVRFTPTTKHSIEISEGKLTIALNEQPKKGVQYTLLVTAKSSIQHNYYKKSFYFTDDSSKTFSEEHKAQQDETEYNLRYPDLSIISHTEVSGPFVMNYDYNDKTIVGARAPVLISYSTPNGRVAAINYLFVKGLDPTEMVFRFEGYKNPLTGEAK